MAESEEELNNFLMKVKEESEKVGLKLNIQKTKIMVSRPITSWQIDGETTETEFIFWGSKITADGDCSHDIKRCFLLGRKAMTNLDSILKSREGGVAPRWWRDSMGRPLSPPQIHQKVIWMLSNSQKITSECWWRTPGAQKSSPFLQKVVGQI